MKLVLMDIAKVCHEANRAYCEALNDNSQPPWGEAPKWQKDSAIDGAWFHLAHPGAKPGQSHEEWVKGKEGDGWKYGPVKDPDKKEHPCLVPYEQLPEEQKVKDALFLSVVNALRDMMWCEVPEAAIQ